MLRLSILILVLASALPTLAAGSPPARPGTRPAARPVPSPARPATGPATRPATGPAVPADAAALARRIEAAVARADVSPILQSLDYTALQDRILAGDPVSPPDRRNMLAGMRDSLQFASLVEAARKPTTSYRLLRLRQAGGETRALFRLVSDEGDNYNEWVLVPGPRGPVIVDMESYLTGELLSQTVRRTILASSGAVGSDGKQRIAFAQGKEGAAQLKHLEAMKRLTSAVQSKDRAAVEAAFQALPPELRADRTFVLLRLQGIQSDPDAYLRALDEAIKQHGDGIVGPFNLFDQYFTRKRFNDALAVIDRLDKRVADPYLDFYRALVHLEKGDTIAGKRLLDRVIAAAPDLPDPYKRRINLALNDRDFALMARLMTASEQRAGLSYNAEKMKTAEVFADFVKSPEYAQWVRQKQPPAGATTRPSR